MAKRKHPPAPPETPTRPVDVAAFAFASQQKLRALAPDFQRFFGRKLQDFWDTRSLPGLACGFDLLKFEAELFGDVPDGTSLAEAIDTKCGLAARVLINRLISEMPKMQDFEKKVTP